MRQYVNAFARGESGEMMLDRSNFIEQPQWVESAEDCTAPAILCGHDPSPKTKDGGGGGNRTRVQGFEKRAMARDFRC